MDNLSSVTDCCQKDLKTWFKKKGIERLSTVRLKLTDSILVVPGEKTHTLCNLGTLSNCGTFSQPRLGDSPYLITSTRWHRRHLTLRLNSRQRESADTWHTHAWRTGNTFIYDDELMSPHCPAEGSHYVQMQNKRHILWCFLWLKQTSKQKQADCIKIMVKVSM